MKNQKALLTFGLIVIVVLFACATIAIDLKVEEAPEVTEVPDWEEEEVDQPSSRRLR